MERSRREFIKGAVIGTGGLAAALTLGCDNKPTANRKQTATPRTPEPTSTPVNLETLRKSSFASEIKKWEDEHGHDNLTLKEAQSQVTSIAGMFAESVGSHFSQQEFIDRTFILHGSFDYQGRNISAADLFNLEGIRNLKNDYPSLELTEDEARSIAVNFRGNLFFKALGLHTRERHIFVNLDSMNATDPQEQEFSQIGSTVNCQSARKSVGFRHTLTHEFFHLEVEDGDKPADERLTDSFSLVYKPEPFTPIPQSYDGFKVNGNWPGESLRPFFVWLDELATEHLAVQASIANGLTFTTYGLNPNDLANFEIILKAAGIGPLELSKLHGASNVTEFFTRMGQTAKKDPMTGHPTALDTGVEISFRLAHTKPILWKSLKEFYPEIDTNSYGYPDNPFRKDVMAGCVNLPK
ncbi:hypothetical protein HYW40_03195 [Candidatus Curtissbacteria bacterium]|nr:hypothetical protein [Candidatus Curtissbacteria bacterium]